MTDSNSVPTVESLILSLRKILTAEAEDLDKHFHGFAGESRLREVPPRR